MEQPDHVASPEPQGPCSSIADEDLIAAYEQVRGKGGDEAEAGFLIAEIEHRGLKP